MDLDAYERVRAGAWARLDELARRRRLSGAEADELVRHYQAAATDLSVIRSSAPDPATVTRLSQLVARGRAAIAGSHQAGWRDVTRFVVISLPAALYRLRWWIVAVMVGFVALAVASGVYVATVPEALALMGTPAEQQQYVDQMFQQYYNPGAGFAAMVWTNNAWITAVCVATGITGVLPVVMLVSNAIGVGSTGGMMAAHGQLDVFLQSIAPHGLLELTSVFVAGAAGLRIFWTWLVPGPRTRSRALAQEGRALITVAIGLVGTLAVSGLIEGFVTGSTLPWAVKITLGVIAVTLFWVYTVVLGRRAVRDGETGDLEADRAGYMLAMVG